MSFNSKDMIPRLSDIALVGLATAVILLIPLTAMRFTDQVNWDPVDFMIMGVLVFGTGSLSVLAFKNVPPKHRAKTVIFLTLAFLYVWAELAVGIFTNLGS